MTSSDCLSSLPNEFEEYILEFEAAWHSTNAPNWHQFVSAIPVNSDQRVHLRILAEIVSIDLEMRWQRGIGKYVEDYLSQEPQLNEPFLLIEMISEEYRARCRMSAPKYEEYGARFPRISTLVKESLTDIDRERNGEVRSKAIPPSKEFVGMTSVFFEENERATVPYQDYVIERFIGAGGSGKVYRARKHQDNHYVAVKFLKKSFLNQPEAIKKFLRESRLVSNLRHPGIVRQHGVGRTPQGGYFLVMDWLPCGDLDQRLRSGQVSARDAVRWVRDAALAIHFAHNQGITHCDLKPANILLNQEGCAVITDFGLARSITDTGDTFRWLEGTAGFMALEQVVRGYREIGPKTDIFGLGALLYSLLDGHAPYHSKRPSDSLSQLIADTPIQSLLSRRPEIPESVQGICMNCLARDPDQRPESGQVVAHQLQSILNEL
jgi:tRNA A-37 threonylcarbamoyl transferase component Bud32